MANAGRTAPHSPSRKPMVVIERMAMTRSTMPEEAKMAGFTRAAPSTRRAQK
jgi:hypothetical protein